MTVTGQSTAALTLILYLLYLLLAFGLRAFVQYRRTGDAGFRLPTASTPIAQRTGAVLFVAALVLGVAAPVFDLASVLARFTSFGGSGAVAAGFVLYAVGVAGTLWAQFGMGESWRVGVDPTERTALRTVGPFRHVRNPIFSFMVVAAVGLALLVPNLASVAAVVALVAGVELQVRLVEEPHLLRTHRAAYAEYAASTGRFVPGVGRLRFPRQVPYS